MTDREQIAPDMVEAVKDAITNTTDFDGDRMASRYADSELRDLALSAIAAMQPHIDALQAELYEERHAHNKTQFDLAMVRGELREAREVMRDLLNDPLCDLEGIKGWIAEYLDKEPGQ